MLMYISDVLGLEVPELGDALCCELLHIALLPVLLGSLAQKPRPKDAALPAWPTGAAGLAKVMRTDGPARILSPVCALFVLHQLFDVFRGAPSLLRAIAIALLRPQVPKPLVAACLRQPPAPPATYRSTNADVSGPASVAGKSSNTAASEDTAAVGWPTLGLEEQDAGAGGLAASPAHEALLSFLSSDSDSLALLAAGVLHLCLVGQGALPEGDGILAESNAAADDAAEAGEKADAGLVSLLVRALVCHTACRAIVVQVLAGLARDLAHERRECRAALTTGARQALRSAARHALGYLHGAQGGSFLDVFAEESGALQASPPLDIREVCRGVRCLLPSSIDAGAPAIEWVCPAPHAERLHAAKAVHRLLLLRRLCLQLEQLASSPPAPGRQSSVAGASTADSCAAAESPGCEDALDMSEEHSAGYREDEAFDFARQDRIFCTVVNRSVRHDRYLILHDHLLLLVQPDIVSPGAAVVRTLVPLRHIEVSVDSGNPLHLQLDIRLQKGAPCPGEAQPAAPSKSSGDGAMEQRFSGFVLTLVFEDPRRSVCAEQHLRARRDALRAQLHERVRAFVQGLCS
eukprot:NODE_5547_length_1758_cov_6.746781.p1 GENE.NODE_5547_length_1758_cov_6.746781~~NODE_5547_length_1758_cov_6.746781.p1  ORF type:complete len:576 (+),score=167.15 NODE_5547_length_1758_cov_6.746781:1-1728(+)